MTEIKAFVICCNDDISAVVIGSALYAWHEKEQRAKAYYDSTKGMWKNEAEYRKLCHWHLREKPVLIDPQQPGILAAFGGKQHDSGTGDHPHPGSAGDLGGGHDLSAQGTEGIDLPA